MINFSSSYSVYLLIYIGTIFYVLASYFHLTQDAWTFKKALATAIPFVLIEYTFSLRGNYYAYSELELNPLQILIVTMVFYFINMWIFNYFITKKIINTFREVVAFILIISAFVISQNIKISQDKK